MKAYFITIVLLFCSLIAHGQENDYEGALQTDSTWGHEYFEFPIRFAREIPYTGMEDATFPKGWSNTDSEEFWSYVFAWDIHLDSALNARLIERYLQIYFDGLNGLGPDSNVSPDIKQTSAKFFRINKPEDRILFKGKVRTFDHFTTKQPITLNVTVEQHLCKTSDKSIIVFRFSPKEIGETIWDKLNQVKIKKSICNQ